MQTQNRLPWWAVVSMALAALLSLASMAQRHRTERRNQAVGIAVDLESVVELADFRGIPVSDALDELKEAGLTGVAISEETVEKAILPYRVAGSDIPYIIQGRVLEYAGARFPRSGASSLDSPAGEALIRQSLSTPIGINPLASAAVKRADLELIARHTGVEGSNSELVQKTIRDSHALGADWMLPSGSMVLGHQRLLRELAETMVELDMKYVAPEFVQLDGGGFMQRHLKDRTVRLHAVQQAEVTRYSRSTIRERLAKSFRERNVRWLLIRPSKQASDDPLDSFATFIKQVKADIVAAGGAVRTPRPFTEPEIPSWLPILITLAALPALIWIGSAILTVPWMRIGWLVICVGVAGLSIGLGNKHMFALLAAVVFPCGSYIWLFLPGKRSPLLSYIGMSAISLVGGLIVSGTLTGVDYMLQTVMFKGVKVALFFPILVAAFLVLRSQIDFKEAVKKPLLWGSALAAVGAVGALLYMMMRSGNDGAGASGIELQIRAVLDELLFVRPRTKEFMVGHPALMLGLLALAAAAKRPALRPIAGILLAAGAVGQTSLVNTLVHLHTPVFLSSARLMIGLVLGGILGLLAWGVIWPAFRTLPAEDAQ